jgi:hypothetical protein
MFDEFRIPGASFDDVETALMTFVYCSRAADGVDLDEVARIVAFAQSRNRARDITGMLVFDNGVFLQWVEGPPIRVRELTKSLFRDPRHFDVVPLEESIEKRERLYPDWEMEPVKSEDLRAVLEDAVISTEDPGTVAALNRILAHLASAPFLSLGRE